MSASVKLACIDLEGVLVPELWPKIAVHSGVKELFATTREIPDYDALMRQRIGLLREHGLSLAAVQGIIQAVQPFAGAAAFLQALEAKGYRVNIISDCFQELAAPLLHALGGPATFCHRLLTDDQGFVSGCAYFPRRGKVEHVENAQADGMQVLAVGDAFNDLAMLRRANQGFLINPSLATLQAAPDLPTVRDLGEILRQVA